MLKMEPYRRPGEEWCRNQPNIATLRESLNKPYLREAIKGTGESNCKGFEINFQS